jgi:small subunit ribosomal protein S2
MERFIYTKKKGVHIIDLPKTVKLMDKAYDFIKQVTAKGGNVLFVGTKKQAKDSIKEQAIRAEQFYINQR